ncbi:glycosyltransferase [Pelagibacteraceae bacterium]|nr:glycosyltransferase [Pelagibacteraceae bacterium]
MNKFIILIPLFNDWKSVSRLLDEIDLKVNAWKAEVSVLIVNDASTEKRSGLQFNFKKIKFVKILNMKKNTVHQRCIAAGLKYICKNEDFDRVIVMDADGEDRPEELNDFFKKAEENPNMTITGNRFKRSETLIFKILYEVHKVLTLIFTGKLIKFGNFSCLPKTHVEQLIQKPYLWNSYSSSVVRTINDRTFISSIRGSRYVLPSKMNFWGLIFHSLSIISVFRNLVIIRSILLFLIYLFLIYGNISFLTMFPIFCLLVFVLLILKISNRSNMEEFNQSLENIGTIDILDSNSR